MSSVALKEVLNLSSKQVEKSEQATSKRIQLVVFKLGKEEYALSLEQIKEVVRTPNISVIPHTPDFVKGVGNIRGNIMAILDLELRFGIVTQEESDNNIGKYTLVIESSDINLGVIVKEVPTAISITEDKIEYSPSIIYESGVDDKSVQGIVKLDDRMVILIDFESTINQTVEIE